MPTVKKSEFVSIYKSIESLFDATWYEIENDKRGAKRSMPLELRKDAIAIRKALTGTYEDIMASIKSIQNDVNKFSNEHNEAIIAKDNTAMNVAALEINKLKQQEEALSQEEVELPAITKIALDKMKKWDIDAKEGDYLLQHFFTHLVDFGLDS